MVIFTSNEVARTENSLVVRIGHRCTNFFSNNNNNTISARALSDSQYKAVHLYISSIVIGTLQRKRCTNVPPIVPYFSLCHSTPFPAIVNENLLRFTIVLGILIYSSSIVLGTFMYTFKSTLLLALPFHPFSPNRQQIFFSSQW